MDLRHAKTFVTVAELRTVSRAAEHLHTAQPALSRQISDFESELGIRLFDRVGRRLVLTGEGEQLLGDCRALLSCATAIRVRAQELRRGDAGVLKVAASPQIIDGTLSKFLRRYAEPHPQVQVRLIEAIGSIATDSMLERGDIHLGISLMSAIQPGDQRFAVYPLESIDLLAASASTFQIGDDGKIETAALASQPLLLLDTSYIFRRNFDAACRLAGLVPNIVYESQTPQTPQTLLAMAESGPGVAVIPSGLRTDRHSLRLVAITYRGEPLRERLAIYWDRRRPLARYASEFCEMLAAYTREHLPLSRPTVVTQHKQSAGAGAKKSDDGQPLLDP